MMKELINEHVYARTATANLEKAKNMYVNGNAEALNDVWKFLSDLAEFYPKHISARYIEKENKKFFIPSMEYFTPCEQETMLQEFWDFDRKLIHQKYAKTAAEMENIL